MISPPPVPPQQFLPISQRLAALEVWVVLLLVLLSMLQEAWLPWAVVGIALASLLRLFSRPPVAGRKSWSVRTPVDAPAVLLLLMALLSLLVTPLPEVTRPQVLRLLTGMGLFYAIINWAQGRQRLQVLALGVVAATFGLAALAVFSVRWPVNKLPFIPLTLYTALAQRISDTIHPNVLAGNLAILMPFVLGLFIFPWGRQPVAASVIPRLLLRLLVGLGLLAAAVVLILTQSRGSWLAFGAAGALILILRFRWGWLAVLATGIAGTVAVFLFLDVPILLRSLRSSYLVGELAGRIELWARAIFILEDFPFTGAGMGTYAQTTDALYPLRSAAPQHAHNLFLQIGIDLGIPGLLAWLVIWFLVIYAAWEIWRSREAPALPAPDAWLRGLGAGLLGSQLVLGLHGLFDAVTWGMIRPAPLIWALWGLAMAAFIWRGEPAVPDPGKN